jgi:enediyne biosynthesis protein E4
MVGRRCRFPALGLAVLLSLNTVSALDWKTGQGCTWASLPSIQSGHSGFTLLNPSTTGVLFTNQLAVSRYTTNQSLLNGSGIALGDIDGDGLCDIYACSPDGPNALFRNRGGWKFENVTARAGVACPNFSTTSCALADIDGDADLDLIVSSFGNGTLIFYNDGSGRFAPSGQELLNPRRAAMSMALADIDGDGDLDLYIANYRMVTIRDQPNTRFRVSTASGKPEVIQVNGRPVTEPDLAGRFELDPNGKIVEHGEPDALYLNDGKGKFTSASFNDGRFLDEDGKPLAGPLYDWGLSVSFRDLNQDGAPDLYVCNDFNSPDRIWINDGKGRFRALPRLAIRTTSLFSMGVDFADLNRDGYDDIYVVDMFSRDHRKRHNQLPDILPPNPRVGEISNRPQYNRNTLFVNRGDLTFAEIGQFGGLYASEWSWSPVFLDVDLDGYEDVLIVTGNERDSMNADIARDLNARLAQQRMSVQQVLDLRKVIPRLELPNLAFRNLGNMTFQETGAAWGFNTQGVSQTIALADLDNDGDLDVVVNNLNGVLGVYRNESAAPRLAVRLKGLAPNTSGAGARITIMGGPVRQSQEMHCAGRYLSSDDAVRVFAAGAATNRLKIQVNWRSGRQSVIENASANCIYQVDEAGAAAPADPALQTQAAGAGAVLFEDVSARLNHLHREQPFDDFARQPLLQRRLSQLGPGVAWHDLNADGWDDLIIGSGAGGRLAVYLNDTQGGFQPVTNPPVSLPVTRDQTTVLAWTSAPGKTVILAGSANYEDGLAVGAVARQYDLAAASIADRLPGQPSSTGPLALADIAGDGRLALFVGGRVLAGRYPQPASSMLFRQAGESWQLDSENTRLFRDFGLVSAAVWSDLDQDGLPELILACDAGPVRIFQNHAGKLADATEKLGMANYRGLWNGVTTADFDGDGKLDIIAANWGWNHHYQSQAAGNLRWYYGDFLANGAVELIEAYLNAEMGKSVPFASFASMTRALPFVRERIGTHEAYGLASVEEILGERIKAAKVLEINTLASMVFLNRTGRFEPHPLPAEAQWAPAFGVSVGDMDGDGAQDVFLSQNFFALQPEIPRMDAGRGLWLKGDGRGAFTAVPGQESGIQVYGEQRGCALADFDRDGRLDLVVTQNGAATRLFRNVGAKPGLRVRLQGTPGNPTGIGACLRLMNNGRMGPAVEIHAGAGYWSQDSAVLVMAGQEAPAELWVRWPGGKTTTSTVPTNAREITVHLSGEVTVVR